MNKVQEAFSHIKLKDYEKKWLASVIGYIAFLIFLRLTLSKDSPELLGVVAVLVFMVWTVLNAIGVIYVTWRLIEDWYENLDETSWVYKVLNWFNSSDRN